MMRRWQCAWAAIGVVLLGAAIGRADPPDVPDGSPKELVAFMQGLVREQPHDAESMQKTRQALIKAADKILEAKPSDDQLAFAVGVKAAMLQDPEELAAFEKKLKKSGQKAAAQIVHVRLLVLQVQKASTEAALTDQINEFKKFLAAGPLQPGDDQAAIEVASSAERAGGRFAGDTCEGLAKLLGAEPKFAAAVRQLQASARRLKLVGNAMHLEGKTLDGKLLDWPKFRGKVVLIDFWATWCGPCRAEIPNIKAAYEKFHGKGFEVIGISLDRMSSQELADFVKKEDVPWTICRDADSPQNMAEYYGINGIPQLILVGRDGNVVTLNARGPALEPAVVKALAAGGGEVTADDLVPEKSAKADTKSGAKADKSSAKTDAKKAREQKRAEEQAALKERREQAAKEASARQPRTWTDATGKFQVTAKFRGMANGVVRLELEDGRIITLALEKLSDDDQECIRQRKY